MEWVTALLGFALGLLSSYLVLRVQRNWQLKEDRRYTEQVLKNLVIEIDEGLERTRYMAGLASQNSESYGRIYTGLWDSSNQRLAATLEDADTMALLHRIYYRFALINFNCDQGRAGVGGAFAAEYLSELEANAQELHARLP
ncbi:MAG: hypothetical protein AB2L09_12760 [Coriobacteriia bacterium]